MTPDQIKQRAAEIVAAEHPQIWLLTADEAAECAERALREGMAMQQGMPDELTPKQIVSACFALRHDFGLLPADKIDLLFDQCREWWRAISKELNCPSQHPMVLAAAHAKQQDVLESYQRLLRDLLSPEALGHAVSQEVRDRAKALLAQEARHD